MSSMASIRRYFFRRQCLLALVIFIVMNLIFYLVTYQVLYINSRHLHHSNKCRFQFNLMRITDIFPKYISVLCSHVGKFSTAVLINFIRVHLEPSHFPSQWHPLTKTVLTPWEKILKNSWVFNTLDNSKTPRLQPGKNSNTSRTP